MEKSPTLHRARHDHCIQWTATASLNKDEVTFVQPGFVRRHGMLARLTQDRADFPEGGRRPSPCSERGGSFGGGGRKSSMHTPKLESDGKFIRKGVTLRRQRVVCQRRE